MPPISGRVARKIRVLVADSSRIHTQLLSDALRRDPGLEVVDWNWDPAALVPFIQTHQIDVLAISSALNDENSRTREHLRALQTICPETRMIVLLDSQNDEDVLNAFRAGARGIFGREGCAEMFCKCIHRIFHGEIWVDNRGVELAVQALAATPAVRAARADGMNLLSKREAEVVRCVVQGLTNQEIADHMGLSRHTIKNYLFRIFDKLGVSSRVELLFMTLNHNGHEENSAPPPPKPVKSQPALPVPGDDPTFEVFAQAAEHGIPTAQLALAQAYLARQTAPDDLIDAYMWNLIASESVAQARPQFTAMLTARQIDEAERRASHRLAHMKQPSARKAAAAGRLPLSQVI